MSSSDRAPNDPAPGQKSSPEGESPESSGASSSPTTQDASASPAASPVEPGTGTGDPTGTPHASAGASAPEQAPARSFLEELAWRRVPHIVGAYLGGTWTFFKFMLWVCERAQLPVRVADMTLLCLASLLPSVAFVAYRHGRSGLHAWGRFEVASLTANLLFVVGGIVALTSVQGDLISETVASTSPDPEGPEPRRSTVQIVASPSRATVFKDGSQRLGETPLRHPFAEDTVSLRIQKAGYLPVDTTLRLGDLTSDSLMVSLQKQPMSRSIEGASLYWVAPPSAHAPSADGWGLPTDTLIATYMSTGETAGTPDQPSDSISSTKAAPPPSDAGRNDSLAEAERKARQVKKLLQKARTALEAGHLTTPEGKSAYDLAEKILAIKPGNETAEALKGRIARRYVQLASEAKASGNLEQSIEHLETSLNVQRQPSIKKRLEDLRRRLKRRREIRRLLHKARATLDDARSPETLEEVIAMAKTVLKRKGPSEEATALLTEAWARRGEILAGEGHLSGAIDSYDKALKIDSTASTWYNRGRALFRQGRFSEAIESYDQALKINPSFARAWANRGAALEKKGNLSQAVGSYDKALEVGSSLADSSLASVWTERGLALAKQKQFSEALESFNRAIETDSTHAPAWYNRGVVLKRQGKSAKAQKSVDRACTVDPSFEKC